MKRMLSILSRLFILSFLLVHPIYIYSQTADVDINPTSGYKRIEVKDNSFEYYLRHLPLKPSGSKVLYYNGAEKRNQAAAYAVVDMDIGNKDLQQCADAVIRLRAEYLYMNKLYDRICFNFTSGFKAEYKKWAEGYRIKVNGNKVSWYKHREKDYSYKTFRAYLDYVFMYAGTLSLSAELISVPYSSLNIGDVFIQGGSPGHAVIVTDIAVNPTTNKKVYILAQSYMPAQDIHILVNPVNKKLSPWYELSSDNEPDKVITPEWTFTKKDLKRFK